MRRMRALCLAVLLLCAAQPLSAQQYAEPDCPFDTAARTRMDTVLIRLAAGSRIGNTPELHDEYLNAATVISMYYQPPAQIVVPLWARTFGGRKSKSDVQTTDPGFGFDGDVRFQLDSAGRLVGDSVHIETLHPAFAESVVAAVLRADSVHGFAPPTRLLRRHYSMIRLHFAREAEDGRPGAMLLRVIVPAVRVDKAPAMQSIRRLNYPDDLRQAHMSGRIVLQFVVTAEGEPDLGTLSVVQGEFRGFALEALNAVSTARFTPAMIGSCRLSTLVRMPFDFKLGQ
jgi:TonB family protein